MKTGPWRKSSRSSNNGGACVEARHGGTAGVDVRDSKLDAGSPILSVSADEWRSFLSVVTR